MNKETLDVFTVQEVPGKDNYWTPVGVAWTNKDNSINGKLYGFPVNSKINIRRRKGNEEMFGKKEVIPQPERPLDCVMIVNNTKVKRWIRNGAAWVNRDGSVNAVFNAIPSNFEFHIRERKKKDEVSVEEIPF